MLQNFNMLKRDIRKLTRYLLHLLKARNSLEKVIANPQTFNSVFAASMNTSKSYKQQWVSTCKTLQNCLEKCSMLSKLTSLPWWPFIQPAKC